MSGSVSMNDLSDLSSSFPLPPPSFPRALTAPSVHRSAALPVPQGSPGAPISDTDVQCDSGENWLTSPPFGDTPPLTLAVPNVGMPVFVGEARWQSARGRDGKRVSLTSTAAVTPPRSSSLVHSNAESFASTPSLLSRSRSHSLSSEGPTTPSAAASLCGADSVMLADDDEYTILGGVDLSLVSSRDFDVASQDASSENAHEGSAHKPVLAHAHSLWSLPTAHEGEGPAHKPALAHAQSMWSLRHHRSYAKGTSFLSFGSGDSTSSAFLPAQAPPHPAAHSRAPSYSPLRLGAETPAVDASLSPYDAALAVYAAVESAAEESAAEEKESAKRSKTSGTMRRIFRTLGRRRN